MRRLCCIHLVFALALCLGAIAGQPAYAQDDEDTGDVFELEEVTVTANKRIEDLQAVPRSIAVVSSDDMDLRSASSIQDILSTTPGINFQGFNSQIFLRGVGPAGTMMNDPGNEPSVQFNVDGNLGIYVPSVGVSPVLLAMNDVERIEIIRGPAGAINGRMAAAGTINVITKDPDFDRLDANVSVLFGDYDTQNLSAATNLPLKLTGLDLPAFIENLSFRVAARQDKHSEYIHNAAGEGVSGSQDFTTFRTKMKWEPIESLSILAQFSFSEDKSNSQMGVPAIDQVQLFPPGGEPHPQDPWLNANAPAAGEPNAQKQYTSSIEASWTNSYGMLTAKYGKNWVPIECRPLEPGAPPPPGGGVCYDGDIYQNEYELRMSSLDDSKIQWMLGAYKYYKKEYSGPDTQLTAIDPDAVTVYFSDFYGRGDYFRPFYDVNSIDFDANDPNRSWALPGVDPVTADSAIIISQWATRPIDSHSFFGNISIPFFEDKHRFSIGLRKTIEEKKRANVLGFFMADENNTNGGLPHFTFYPNEGTPETGQWICDNCYMAESLDPFTMTTDDNPISYTIGWEYDWKPEVLVYANVNNGFKPGGISPESVPNVYYDPEYLVNYAVGMRSRWLDNKLQLNAELYLMDYDNLQTSLNSEAPVCYTSESGTEYCQPIRWQSRVVNFDRTQIFGFELDYDWLISPKDRLKGNLAYKDAKYGDKVYRLGTTGLPPGHPEYADFGGRPMPQSPKFSFTANYSHRFIFGNIQVTPRFDVKYSSKYITYNEYWWEYVGAEVWQPAYWKYDAYLNIGPMTGNWQFNAYVKNIDETVIRNIAFFQTSIDAPRTYGAGLTLRF